MGTSECRGMKQLFKWEGESSEVGAGRKGFLNVIEVEGFLMSLSLLINNRSHVISVFKHLDKFLNPFPWNVIDYSEFGGEFFEISSSLSFNTEFNIMRNTVLNYSFKQRVWRQDIVNI